jgi:hypothetical protein
VHTAALGSIAAARALQYGGTCPRVRQPVRAAGSHRLSVWLGGHGIPALFAQHSGGATERGETPGTQNGEPRWSPIVGTHLFTVVDLAEIASAFIISGGSARCRCRPGGEHAAASSIRATGQVPMPAMRRLEEPMCYRTVMLASRHASPRQGESNVTPAWAPQRDWSTHMATRQRSLTGRSNPVAPIVAISRGRRSAERRRGTVVRTTARCSQLEVVVPLRPGTPGPFGGAAA